MKNKEIKERLTMIYGHLNRISIIGAENAENMVIAVKLLQDLVQHVEKEGEKEGGADGHSN